MSKTNGTTVIATEKATDRESHRPTPSTTAVQEEIIASLGRIVGEALRNGSGFVSLADHYDRDKTTAIRYGHLVDAAECVEIALEYLGLMKSTLSYQLRVEDAVTDEPLPF